MRLLPPERGKVTFGVKFGDVSIIKINGLSDNEVIKKSCKTDKLIG